ncbi:hypothetical protein [Porphyromonas endodontalis]|uniref:hypothetical protein n=1 Tax=Porphyromonas endodontalis TaxID=28124 RepID=UPI00288B5DA9|nr:hypothetical protein [Porphyromonas endodontalis]
MMNRKHHWFYHAIFCGAVLLAAIAPSLAQEKSDTKGEGPLVLVSTAPQHLLFGIDLGIERSLTPKFSLGADLTTHLWLLEMPNIAISPMAKYYFTGTVGAGIYARVKAVAGYFFGTTVFDAPYYAGGGVGFGFLLPIGKTGRWHLGADCGIKLAIPFGDGGDRPALGGDWGITYYTLLSPASIPELSIRIAYSL